MNKRQVKLLILDRCDASIMLHLSISNRKIKLYILKEEFIMENASKALIIAGAILLSILLISLGILVYNNAKGTIQDANLDSEEAQTFNTKISQYCGTKKSAIDMNSLMDAIAASNGAQNKLAQAERHYISVKTENSAGGYITGGGTITVDATSAASGVTYPSFNTGTTYTATYKTGADGYINYVTVKPAA